MLGLVAQADVVLESFRPGVMERLGLGYDRLAAVNSKLIYCGISGFGRGGPWSGRPAYDQIVQGLSGAMSVTGTADTAPLRTGFPIADTIGGLTAAFAIAAALVRQQQTGQGERIDVSMLESMLAAMGWVVSNTLNGGVDWNLSATTISAPRRRGRFGPETACSTSQRMSNGNSKPFAICWVYQA